MKGWSACLVFSAGALLLAASGCGKSQEHAAIKPEAWAAEFCGTLARWQYTKARDGVELLPKFQRSKNLRVARADLVELADRWVKRTDTMLADLEAMEPPPVDDGPAIQGVFVRGFAQIRPVFVHARERARTLPITSRSALQRGFHSLNRAYLRELDSKSNAFDALKTIDSSSDAKDRAVSRAYDSDPTCRQISPPK